MATAGRRSWAGVAAAYGAHSERRHLRATFAEPLCKTLPYPEKTPRPHTYELSNSIRNFPVWRGSNQLSSHATKRRLSSRRRTRFFRLPNSFHNGTAGLGRSDGAAGCHAPVTDQDKGDLQ